MKFQTKLAIYNFGQISNINRLLCTFQAFESTNLQRNTILSVLYVPVWFIRRSILWRIEKSLCSQHNNYRVSINIVFQSI